MSIVIVAGYFNLFTISQCCIDVSIVVVSIVGVVIFKTLFEKSFMVISNKEVCQKTKQYK